jgi:hypothetical protein
LAKKRIEFKVDENGCFICMSHKNLKGNTRFPYPHIKIAGKKVLLHRFISECIHGPIPPGVVIRHRCDNPRCINPLHLEDGTIADNVADMMDRDRHAKGRNCGTSTLTEEQVRMIKEGNERAVELAERLGVHPSTIWRVRAGDTWRHIK